MSDKLLKTTTGGAGFYRTALKLALPIAFQNLLTSCGTLVDTVMIVGLGNAATSAIGVAARFSFLLNVICFGFASGCSALLSQYWGAKEKNNLLRCLGFALSVALGFGLLYAVALALFPAALAGIFTDDPQMIALAASYLRVYAVAVPFLVISQILSISLRSVECVRLPLISSGIAVAVNVAVNYCLIGGHFGFPALGLRGAACGTIVSYAVQAAFLVTCMVLGKTPFRGTFRGLFAFDRAFCKTYLRTASPVLINEALWACGTNVYAMILARQGMENYAGYTLYENVQQIFFVFFVGICGACAVMVGMRVGAGEHGEAYRAAKRFAVMTPITGVVLGGLLVLLREPLLSLFPIETAGARQVASECLLFYGFWIGVHMISYTMVCGIFRSGGDTKTGCLVDMAGLYFCGIPALFLVARFLRPTHFAFLLATMFIAEDVVKTVLCLIRFRSRKWIRQITSSPEIEEFRMNE